MLLHVPAGYAADEGSGLCGGHDHSERAQRVQCSCWGHEQAFKKLSSASRESLMSPTLQRTVGVVLCLLAGYAADGCARAMQLGGVLSPLG